ncbi:MAG: hypothetical protein K2W99_01840 [Chthoniobacterales bacterium]|nr:hypothetical protein [Chthoniobacterales bacterium]
MKTAFELHHTVRQTQKELAFHYVSLKEELNIPKRLRHSIQDKPWHWLCGATLMGLSIVFFKKPYQQWKKKGSTTFSSHQLSSIEENKKISSLEKSSILMTALSLLSNNAVRTGLVSTARVVFPLAQEALTIYLAHRAKKLSQRRNEVS